MDILINDEKLDFALEKERNIGDVVKNVEDCLVQGGNVIESILVDDRAIPFDYTSDEFRRNLSEVKILRIITSNQAELAFRTIVTVGEYISKILDEYLSEDFLQFHDDVIEGLNLIYEGIIGSMKILKIKYSVVIGADGRSIEHTLSKLKGLIIKYEKQYLDEEGIGILDVILKNLLQTTPTIFKWAVIKNYSMFSSIERNRLIAYLKTIYSDLYTVCLRSVKKFEAIGSNLQLGEDLNALHDLFFLADLIEEIISIFAVTNNILGGTFGSLFTPSNFRPPDESSPDSHPPDFSQPDFSQPEFSQPDFSTPDSHPPDFSPPGFLSDQLFHSLSCKLKEVEKAFKERDMITVGDVLEYDVKPLFESIMGRLEKINDLL